MRSVVEQLLSGKVEQLLNAKTEHHEPEAIVKGVIDTSVIALQCLEFPKEAVDTHCEELRRLKLRLYGEPKERVSSGGVGGDVLMEGQ